MKTFRLHKVALPTSSISLAQQAWQLGDVARYPSRFILSQYPSYTSVIRIVAGIDVGKRLSV